VTTTEREQTSGDKQSPHFATTRWSVVAAAGAHGNPQPRRAALSTLCESYWFPIYAYARRSGSSPEDASDLVQNFFTRLLERNDLEQAKRERGRFRSYLLTCFINFCSNERDRARTIKRGGGRVGFSLDEKFAENRFNSEPHAKDDPERCFARTWAHTVLEEVIEQLRTEYEQAGKGEVFEHLKLALQDDDDALSYREIAKTIETTEGAVKVAAHRLRKRFGELLLREIADTLTDANDAEDELRGLFEALG
jgi:RNA polymerase sigma factor (sigma-70 family)